MAVAGFATTSFSFVALAALTAFAVESLAAASLAAASSAAVVLAAAALAVIATVTRTVFRLTHTEVPDFFARFTHTTLVTTLVRLWRGLVGGVLSEAAVAGPAVAAGRLVELATLARPTGLVVVVAAGGLAPFPWLVAVALAVAVAVAVAVAATVAVALPAAETVDAGDADAPPAALADAPLDAEAGAGEPLAPLGAGEVLFVVVVAGEVVVVVVVESVVVVVGAVVVVVVRAVVVVVVAVVVVVDVVGGGVGAPLTAVRSAVKYESLGNWPHAELSAAHTSPALRDLASATACATLASLVPWITCHMLVEGRERPHSLAAQF